MHTTIGQCVGYKKDIIVSGGTGTNTFAYASTNLLAYNDGLYIKPIANGSDTNILYYDTILGEVLYDNKLITDLNDLSSNLNTRLNSDIVKIGKDTGAGIGQGTVAIGFNSCISGNTFNSVIVGRDCGQNNCESSNVAIGYFAGQNDMSNSSVAIGWFTGQTNQGFSCVAVGRDAGQTNQGHFGVGLGRGAAQNNQKDNAIAIGRSSGRNNQNFNSISIGYLAGEIDQSLNSIAIGSGAARTTQGRYAVSIGENAGNLNQGENAIAIGRAAGNDTQSVKGVAIGFNAGILRQGAASIAIGSNSGHTDQSANSIILNATDTLLNSTAGTSTFYVKPIRNAVKDNYLYYDTSSGEITYSATTSDDRLKHNEQDLSNCLSIINLLKPKIYDKTEIILDASYNGSKRIR